LTATRQTAVTGRFIAFIDSGEVILYAEPDTTFLLRLQNMLFTPFVSSRSSKEASSMSWPTRIHSQRSCHHIS
jgi:hypothetical protein